jgi:anti-sigma regulatory factor (Ser/Thr protein kinase)
VLTSADELVRGLAEDSLVTCVYAVYDPRQERLVLANAGHVPPLLLGGPGGGQQVVELPATGPPLGAGGREPYGERVVDLRADQLLVLYTDGLVETRHDALDTGIDRLAAALHPVPDDLEAACSAVTGLLPRGSQDDDVAVLLVRPDPATRPAATRLQLEAGPRAAGRARAHTAGTLAGWGEPERTLEVAELAVSELVTNGVRHAGTPVDLQLSRHEECVVIEVSDGADGVPRWRRAAPDDEGGRGLMLVAELADAWGSRSRPDGGKTVWCRIDRRPAGR